MKKEVPYIVNSISEQNRILSLSKPLHPMVCVFNFDEMLYSADSRYHSLIMNLYCVSLKREVQQKVRYGQSHYDFDEGIMAFTAPQQLVSNIDEAHQPKGWCLSFHPDFIRKHPLGRKIKNYHFFSYEASEALHLSEKEEETVVSLMKMMRAEIEKPIDAFSEDVLISYIELLLSYADRFYNRQFYTRKNLNTDVLLKFEALLEQQLNAIEQHTAETLSVQYFSEQLNLSPNYLSNVLKTLTGKSTQGHIQDALIEKTKSLLVTSNLSIAEIAYLFGFEYPQSFHKLFKKKVQMSPLEYRRHFN